MKTYVIIFLLLGTSMLVACSGTRFRTMPLLVKNGALVEWSNDLSDRTGLLAGFGRSDITPPPGVSLAGNGPEAQIARGYRHRLYARTMVLRGANNSFIAIVATDLPLMSDWLHRQVAEELIARGTPIGAENLYITATHTHSGPGNYFGAAQYNHFAGVLSGYDRVMFAFLLEGMVSSVMEALHDMKPAMAGWNATVVRGLTRNRSLEAFEENPEASAWLNGKESTDAKERAAVDSTMLMLRVDQCDESRLTCHPKGALSVFAIHGTGYPAASALIDGDVFGPPQRMLERHIESENPHFEPSFYSNAFHLMVNGAEGDVSPDHLSGTRCEDHLELRPGSSLLHPFIAGVPEVWSIEPELKEDCLRLAYDSVSRIGRGIGEAAISLFEKSEALLRSDLDIHYAFTTVDISTQSEAYDDVCSEPRSGLSNLAGSTEDARTRLEGWRLLGLVPLGFEEGGRAIDEDQRGCDGAKRKLLGPLQDFIVTPYSFPNFAQLAVVQIGNGMLATFPAEITTIVGHRIKNTLLRYVPATSYVGVMGITNGYLQYITTAEEYAKQHYEGGSNLYGPGTARLFRQTIDTLAASVHQGNPIIHVDSIKVDLGNERVFFPHPERGPAYSRLRRTFLDIQCTDATITVEWLDAYPGRYIPAEGQMLQLERQTEMGWERVAWDDQEDIEIYADKQKGRKGYRWKGIWKRPGYSESELIGADQQELYRFVLMGRTNISGILAPVVGTVQNNGAITCDRP